jgi:hypothetical protein
MSPTDESMRRPSPAAAAHLIGSTALSEHIQRLLVCDP